MLLFVAFEDCAALTEYSGICVKYWRKLLHQIAKVAIFVIC